MNLKIVLILVLNCYLTLLDGQIIGTIKGQDAEILPFASIYLKNGSRGTTSNIDGKYELMLPAGQYQIVFQYTGYAKHIHVVEYDGIKLQLDIQLVPLIHELQEVVFSSKREDPAYDIIRAAIKNRKSTNSITRTMNAILIRKACLRYWMRLKNIWNAAG